MNFLIKMSAFVRCMVKEWHRLWTSSGERLNSTNFLATKLATIGKEVFEICVQQDAKEKRKIFPIQVMFFIYSWLRWVGSKEI